MPPTRGYTHVVETVSPSRTIYLSGQLGMMPDGKFAGAPGDFRAQATQCFENLKAGLATAGATFEHVVKTTSYFIDISHLPIFLEVRDRYVNTKAPPGSTAVQIGNRSPALCSRSKPSPSCRTNKQRLRADPGDFLSPTADEGLFSDESKQAGLFD